MATSWRFCAAQIALCHELFGFHGGAGQRGRPRGDMLDALGSAAGLATMNALYILTTLWRHLATGLARFRCARRMASASCCRSIGLIDKHHDTGDNDRPGQVFPIELRDCDRLVLSMQMQDTQSALMLCLLWSTALSPWKCLVNRLGTSVPVCYGHAPPAARRCDTLRRRKAIFAAAQLFAHARNAFRLNEVRG